LKQLKEASIAFAQTGTSHDNAIAWRNSVNKKAKNVALNVVLQKNLKVIRQKKECDALDASIAVIV